jgi:signal transduction histidine kinase
VRSATTSRRSWQCSRAFAGDEIARERARTELDEAVKRLTRAEALRAELIEELAHELRAPLQVIDGYVEGMLDGVLAREDATLALIRREAGRSVRLWTTSPT